MTTPRTAAELRTAVIREITISPGWNKEDATALVDELILSLPYAEDPARKRAIEDEAAALDVELLARALAFAQNHTMANGLTGIVGPQTRQDAQLIAVEYARLKAEK